MCYFFFEWDHEKRHTSFKDASVLANNGDEDERFLLLFLKPKALIIM